MRREDRAVHVVDGGGEEEQEADEPADVGGLRGCAGGEFGRVGFGLGGHSGSRRKLLLRTNNWSSRPAMRVKRVAHHNNGERRVTPVHQTNRIWQRLDRSCG